MSPAQPRSILLIDDDAISREVMQMTLEMHGYFVVAAEDGLSALEVLRDGPELETILMDTQMPGLSGVDLIAALRAASQARVVAISASDPGEALRKAADGFLLKPIEVANLTALLTFDPPPASASTKSVASIALLDPTVFAKLKAMMPAAALKEIYMATAADLGGRLQSLEAAMDSINTREVSRIAHSIKGGCAMVGLTGAREAAARLEVSNLPVTWEFELVQLHIALQGLESMLASDFSA